MKKSVILFVALCGGIACAIVYLDKNHPAPTAPAPMVAATPAPADAAPAPDKTPVAPVVTASPAPATVATPTPTAPTTSAVKSDETPNPIHKVVDALLSAKSAQEKHDLFQQLIKSDQIDSAIEELKQRAADNPTDAEIPTTLGEAMINKVGAIHAAGGDINEQGILAMQADQSFNAALKIDPQNFEAQLVKSISMTYWPAEPTRDAQVVQTLSGLIDRQETMPSQPDFAQTYIYLGNEYQKIGQPDKAQATYQLGLSKFPSDPTLQKKISGQ